MDHHNQSHEMEGIEVTEEADLFTCSVCCEDYPSLIKCNFCNYETCTECAQHYLLSSIETAHCMNCRKGWTRERMLEVFHKKFVMNEYKKHRENVLFDKEKSLLPATQPYAERELLVRAKKDEIKAIEATCENAKREFYDQYPVYARVANYFEVFSQEMLKVMLHTYRYYTSDPLLYLKHNLRGKHCHFPCSGRLSNGSCASCGAKCCDKCGQKYFLRQPATGGKVPQHVCKPEEIPKHKRRNELLEQFRILMNTADVKQYDDLKPMFDNMMRRFKKQINSKRNEMRLIPKVSAEGNTAEEKEKRTFVRACPVNDCRGFLSSAWKCGMCENYTCPHCHEVKGKLRDTPHVCDPDMVETAQLLAKETKPCPTCGARIFKINGCQQMWCTICHTAFCWSTGQVEKGNIHNPHYYEYMRQNNMSYAGGMRREIGDIPCGGLPDYRSMVLQLQRFMFNPSEYAPLERYHRVVGEVIDLRTWYRNRNLEDTRDIRVRYLVKDYDVDKFKKMLQMKAKAQEKVVNIDQVLDMFVMATSTILQRIAEVTSAKEGRMIFVELEGLRKYTNECMDKISVVYDCRTPSIDENIILHRVGERIPWPAN